MITERTAFRKQVGVYTLMRQHGLPTLAARDTAMVEAVTGLPLIVVSALFGVHPGTAHSWAELVQASWAEYLAAWTTR